MGFARVNNGNIIIYMLKQYLVNYKWNLGVMMIVLTYFASHVLSLFVEGAWWDDSLTWIYPLFSLNNHFDVQNANNPFMCKMINFFILNNSNIEEKTLFFRWFPFVLGLLSIIFVYLIIKKLSRHYGITLLTSLIASVSFFDKTCIVFHCFPYVVSLFLTLVGLLAFVYDYKSPKYYFKIATAVSWCLAILIWRSPVAVIPYFIALASCIKVKFNFKVPHSYLSVVIYALRNYWLIILLYLIAILAFFTVLKPGSSHADYYAIHPLNVLLLPFSTLTSCLSFFIQYIGDMLQALCVSGFFFVFNLVLFFLMYKLMKFVKLGKPLENKNMVLVVCGFFYFAMLPFMLNHNVNYSFSNDGWTSRFSSMALLPGSFLIAYLIQTLPEKPRNVMIALVMTSCLTLSCQLYNRYCLGWTKELAITDFLKGHKELEGKKIVFYNNAEDFNVFANEQDRYYELESCARMAYGVETKTKFDNPYMPGDDMTDVDYVMIINKNPDITGRSLTLFNKLFFYEKYTKFKHEMLDIKVVPAKDYSKF